MSNHLRQSNGGVELHKRIQIQFTNSTSDNGKQGEMQEFNDDCR